MLVLAAGVRLALAPVDVAFLVAPRIEGALRERGAGLDVRLGAAEARWDGGIRVRLRDVRAVRAGGGDPVAGAALVAFALRPGDLLLGRFMPEEVRLESPRLALVRDADGGLRLDGAGAAAGALAAPGSGAPGIAFRDGRFEVTDAGSGAVWEVRDLGGSLGPGADGWELDAVGGASLDGGLPARLEVRATAAPDFRDWRAETRFRDLVPDAFAAAFPAAGGLRVPFEGTLRAESGPDGSGASLEAGGRGGSLVFPHPALDRDEDSVPVERASLRIRLDPASGGILVEEARIEGGGLVLHAEGAVADLGAGAGRIDVHLEGGVPIRDAAGWFRNALGRGVTGWFDGSLLAGEVAEAAAVLRLPGDREKPTRVEVDARVERAQLRWRDGAPPLAMDETRVQVEGRRLVVTSAAGVAGPGSLTRLRFEAPDILDPDGGGRFVAVIRGDAGRLLDVVGASAGAGDPELLSGPVEADLDVRIPFAEPAATEVRFGGSFRELGLGPGFLGDQLADVAIEGLAGELDYGPEGVAIRADGGTGGGLAISDIAVEASAPDGGRARVRGTLAGDVRHMLELGGALLGGSEENLPLAAAEVQGSAEMRFDLDAPAAGGGAIEVRSVTGTFDGVRLAPGALAGALGGFGIEGVGGSLDFRPGWLTVEGAGAFAGSGFEFSWRNRSGAEEGGGGFRHALTVQGVFDDAAREAAGFPVPGVEGPVEIRATLVHPWGNGWRIGVDADLGRSRLEVAPLGWRKAVGSPFAVRLSGELGNGPADLALLAEGERAHVRGTLQVDGDARFRGAAFERLEFGETRLAGGVEILPDGTAEMRFAGDRIDLREALGSNSPGPAWPIRLELAADEVLVRGPDPVGPLSLDLAADRAGVREMRALLGLPERQVTTLDARREGSALVLAAEGSDAGVAARAFGLTESLREGEFRVDAVRDDNDPERPLEGRVRVETFRVVDAPVLARLLQVATFTGLFESLVTGGGIRFFDFEGDFGIRGRELTVRGGLARGFSLGLQFDAEVDTAARTVDAEGLVIPAYAIGELFTSIPILGRLFGGLDGEGVLAAEFRIQGPVDDPDVGAAPLTLLLPGVLRDVFGPLLGGRGLRRNRSE